MSSHRPDGVKQVRGRSDSVGSHCSSLSDIWSTVTLHSGGGGGGGGGGIHGRQQRRERWG